MRTLTERFDHDPVGDSLMGELLSGLKTGALVKADGPLIKSGYRQPRGWALKACLCEFQYRLQNDCAKTPTG